MKKLLVVLATLALIASVSAMKAEAASDISVTVTLQNLVVDVTPVSWALGTIAPASNKSSWVSGVAGKFTATNNGNVSENFTIAAGSTTPSAWTVGMAAGVNTYAIGYGHNTVIETPDLEPTYTNFTSAGALASGVAALGTDVFDLRFTAPSSGSTFNAGGETFTVSLSATAA